MSFGYLGDTSTKIKQRVKNDGVLSIDDVRELEVNKQIGGSYQLVQTFDFGGAAFLDIDVSVLGGYDVVFWIGEGITLNSDDAFSVRISKTGDSAIDTGASNYEFGMNSTTYAGTLSESGSTGANNFQLSTDFNSATNDHLDFILYGYNLLNTAHPVFTFHSNFVDASAQATSRTAHGGAEYTQNAVLDVVRFFPTFGSATQINGKVSMYGFKAQ